MYFSQEAVPDPASVSYAYFWLDHQGTANKLFIGTTIWYDHWWTSCSLWHRRPTCLLWSPTTNLVGLITDTQPCLVWSPTNNLFGWSPTNNLSDSIDDEQPVLFDQWQPSCLVWSPMNNLFGMINDEQPYLVITWWTVCRFDHQRTTWWFDHWRTTLSGVVWSLTNNLFGLITDEQPWLVRLPTNNLLDLITDKQPVWFDQRRPSCLVWSSKTTCLFEPWRISFLLINDHLKRTVVSCTIKEVPYREGTQGGVQQKGHLRRCPTDRTLKKMSYK